MFIDKATEGKTIFETYYKENYKTTDPDTGKTRNKTAKEFREDIEKNYESLSEEQKELVSVCFDTKKNGEAVFNSERALYMIDYFLFSDYQKKKSIADCQGGLLNHIYARNARGGAKKGVDALGSPVGLFLLQQNVVSYLSVIERQDLTMEEKGHKLHDK
jgi:hypothetical protein